MAPWNPPSSAPIAIPATSAMIQISGLPFPKISGRISAWSRAIAIPIAASIDPTERSMFLVTITSTIPVAMIATTDVCTERFHRFRGVRNVPPERMLKPTHMTTSAMIIPRRRVSISALRIIEPRDHPS